MLLRIIFVCLGLSVSTQTMAEDKTLPVTARLEIKQLMQQLAQSGCEFYRNGSWYDAEKAQSHLNRKYDYLLDKEMLGSTEDFIRLAGTESSFSGNAYKVRCASITSSSADWLTTQLNHIRQPALSHE